MSEQERPSGLILPGSAAMQEATEELGAATLGVELEPGVERQFDTSAGEEHHRHQPIPGSYDYLKGLRGEKRYMPSPKNHERVGVTRATPAVRKAKGRAKAKRAAGSRRRNR